MEGKFDKDKKFGVGFIDGCQHRTCVESDFHLIWPNLVSGGILGCHDYNYDDWPEVTAAVDGLIDEHQDEIRQVHEIEGSYGISSILLIKK